MTHEVEVSDDSEPVQHEEEGVLYEADDLTYFVTGPSTSFIVQGKQYITPMVMAVCMINGDAEADYKHREVTRVRVTPVQPSIHLMTRERNTNLH